MRLEAYTVPVSPRTWLLMVWLAVEWKPPGIPRAGQPRFGFHSKLANLLTTFVVNLRMALSLECKPSWCAVLTGHMAATLTQWTGQAHDLRPGDMVGLATAEPKGPVKDLGYALDRRRRSVPGPHTFGEEKALALVRRRLPPGTSDEVADRVLRRPS